MWTKLQLFGLGVANVFGSAFSAYPTTGYNLILFPTISLFIEISFNLMFTCSSLAFQVTICENLDKSGFCEWVTTPHMAHSFSIFLQTELFNVFFPPFGLRKYSSELLGKTVNNQELWRFSDYFHGPWTLISSVTYTFHGGRWNSGHLDARLIIKIDVLYDVLQDHFLALL